MKSSVCALILLGLVVAAHNALSQEPSHATAQGGDASAAEGPPERPALPGIPGPQGPEVGALRRQYWLIPGPEGTLMWTTIYLPQGPGPFPLIVVNHGSAESRYDRARITKSPSPFAAAADWFLDRGYAVAAPQRPGFGKTGGRYQETAWPCQTPDYHSAGLAAAASIQAVVSYLAGQSFIRGDDIVVIGSSGGGWAGIALASLSPKNVRAIIVFAAGSGARGDKIVCAPERLVETAGRFGRTARVPLLWINTENDTRIGPELATRMADAFRSSGGRVEFQLLPPFRTEGHNLFPKGNKVWAPIVKTFLASVPKASAD